MSDDPYLDDFPLEGGKSRDKRPRNQKIDPLTDMPPMDLEGTGEDQARLLRMWEGIRHAGLAEAVMRVGTHVLLLALVLLVAWGLRALYLNAALPKDNSNIAADARQASQPRAGALAAAAPTPTPTRPPPQLPAYEPKLDYTAGVLRMAFLHTDVPSRPRSDIITYTVKAGDTVFDISEKFGLNPETILWGNYFVLKDDPHNLREGQDLRILPVDGTYHRWSEGDGLNGVAKYFGVEPEEIVNYPGNNLDPEAIGDLSNPNIEPGTWLIIPGGRREFISWSAPSIPLDNPSVANVLGSGACSGVLSGAVGSGTFIWPAPNRFLSGFDYNPGANHPGIDIDGETGQPVFSADGGVVVYSGWNDWGYGYMVVVNHANGWQSLYAHLSAIYVGCGQSVAQGTSIGAIGSTGNSSGSHLHYEMMYQGTKVNPHNYLQ